MKRTFARGASLANSAAADAALHPRKWRRVSMLPEQLESELYIAREVTVRRRYGGTRQRSEQRTFRVGVETLPVMHIRVHNVERLGAELHGHSFRDPGHLVQRYIGGWN